MEKITKWNIAFAALNVIASLACILVPYSDLPEKVPLQFDINGEPNMYGSKAWLFTFPILGLVLAWIFGYLPIWDPLRENYKHFMTELILFSIVMQLFSTYLAFIMVKWNLGPQFDLPKFVFLGVAAIFLFGGRLQQVSMPNNYIGIRTEWTKQNVENWVPVNKFAGNLFYLAAILCIVGYFTKYWVALTGLGIMVVGVLGLLLYSFIQGNKVKTH